MAMSVALYIVLERQVPGFDHHVNGKALGRLGELLDVLAYGVLQRIPGGSGNRMPGRSSGRDSGSRATEAEI